MPPRDERGVIKRDKVVSLHNEDDVRAYASHSLFPGRFRRGNSPDQQEWNSGLPCWLSTRYGQKPNHAPCDCLNLQKGADLAVRLVECGIAEIGYCLNAVIFLELVAIRF